MEIPANAEVGEAQTRNIQEANRSAMEDTSETNVDIPKIIWILWLQGFENAPEIVKKCVGTWEKANENWRIIKLNRESIKEYISIEKVLEANRNNIEKSDISDVVRIKLLSEYGGVWVDSTCICQRPLDEWLHEYTSSGFFAFSEPAKDREIASWFLASEKGNYLTNEYQKRYVKYFRENKFKRQSTDVVRFIKMKIEGALNINKSMPMLWFSYPIKSLLKIYPYFAFHYKFLEACRKDEKARMVWENTPRYSADGPLRPIRSGLMSDLSSEARGKVIGENVPMYKLNWEVELDKEKEDRLVDHILAQNPYVSNG